MYTPENVRKYMKDAYDNGKVSRACDISSIGWKEVMLWVHRGALKEHS